MITQDEEVIVQRTQVMGRSLLTHLSQVFRNAEIYSPNNQIFAKLLKTLSNHVNESFRVFNNCSIRVSRHNAYIAEHRIYIDTGMVESVHFLANLFETAEIDGFALLPECQEIPVLFQTLLTFRTVVVGEGAKGVTAIRQGLAEKKSPFLEPFPINRELTVLTGLRDKDQAERLALKNALKFILFLKEMEKTLMEQRPLHTSVVYRILLNLIRINSEFPHFILALLHVDMPMTRARTNFYASIMLLAVFRQMGMDRQLQLDLIVDFLFHNVGALSLPAQAKPLPGTEASFRGCRKLLEGKYVNRSFFQRLNCAYHISLDEQDPQILPMHRLMRTVKNFIELWKTRKKGALTSQQCIHRLLKAGPKEADPAALALIAECVGLAPIGSLVVLDRETPVFITAFKESEDHWEIGLETVPDRTRKTEKFQWRLGDETEKNAYLQRLQLASPGPPQPNLMSTVFKKRAY